MALKITSFILILISLSFAAQAKMYKWIDDEGQMHFGDRIPAQYLKKEHDELSDRGDVIKRVQAAETEEEKAAKRVLERERKKQELAIRKKRQRDRVLLDTYTTERDLVLARDARIDAVNSQVQLANSIIEDSNKKILALDEKINAVKSSGRNVPKDMYVQRERLQQQMKVHAQMADRHSKRRDEISTQFNGYIERFRVLKAEQKVRRARIMKERGQQK